MPSDEELDILVEQLRQGADGYYTVLEEEAVEAILALKARAETAETEAEDLRRIIDSTPNMDSIGPVAQSEINHWMARAEAAEKELAEASSSHLGLPYGHGFAEGYEAGAGDLRKALQRAEAAEAAEAETRFFSKEWYEEHVRALALVTKERDDLKAALEIGGNR